MYNESCKTCGETEGEHEVLKDIRQKQMTEGEIAHWYKNGGKPCEYYESEIVHLDRCPIVLDNPSNQEEVYCQELDGGCEELMDMDRGLKNFPD